MDRVYLRGFAQRADDDDADDDGPIRFTVATEGKKADGLDLRMEGLILDRFLANPVVMWGHDYWGRGALPIGRAEDVHVDGKQLLADTVFDLDDEFAVTVDRKYRGGFLNAVSVGFDIRGIDPETGVVDEWELVEYSGVPIPLDPDAVVESGRQRALAMATAYTSARDIDADAINSAIATLRGLLDPDPDPAPGMPLAAARVRLEHLEMLASA